MWGNNIQLLFGLCYGFDILIGNNIYSEMSVEIVNLVFDRYFSILQDAHFIVVLELQNHVTVPKYFQNTDSVFI